MWLVRAFVPRLVLIKMAQSTKAHIFTKIRIKFAFLTFVTLFFGSSLAPCSLYSLSLSSSCFHCRFGSFAASCSKKSIYVCIFTFFSECLLSYAQIHWKILFGKCCDKIFVQTDNNE